VRVVPYLVSAAAVAVVGLAGHALTRALPLPHVSILFIAAVIASAALWGFGPALFAAVLSVAWESFFFYEPIYSFHVADPQQIADLAAFVIVAAFTSRLAASVRARALEAQRRQESIARLLSFSEALAQAGSEADLHATIVEHLSAAFGHRVRLLAAAEAPAAAAEGWRLEPLAGPHGAVAVLATPQAAPAVEPDYARALLDRAALALDRARLRREVDEARVKAQGEALRDALLDSVSHDLQTPLAVILGSATTLESFGAPGDPGRQRELVATIREEGERLASYIDNVLELTRIRSGRITPRLELVELADIVDAALRRKSRALGGRVVQVDLPQDLPMLRLDLFLMEAALANVLDNAAKYAPVASALRISARVEGGEVVLDIEDRGPGIPAAELARVFDPFYRGAGPGDRPPSGTGLGLSICRAFVQANGGTVEAFSAGAGSGATLSFRVPIPAGGDAG
jgi:two-component system sensor histidine kinase KdpD